jgi:hypothetical protein
VHETTYRYPFLYIRIRDPGSEMIISRIRGFHLSIPRQCYKAESNVGDTSNCELELQLNSYKEKILSFTKKTIYEYSKMSEHIPYNL